MAEQISGVELSAQTILKQAVELDRSRRFSEAGTLYGEGIGLLLQVLKSTKDEEKRKAYRAKISEYMEHAEKLKEYVKQQTNDAKYHEQIHIENDSTGHSYDTIFSRCFDEMLTEIEIDDPYIRQNHQVQNFLRFCEMCVKSKSPLKKIVLNTGNSDKEVNQQRQNLGEIAASLRQHGVTLVVTYSNTLHDREVRFNNGWVVQIGRGLDYFKQSAKFTIGSLDMALRRCNETTIDIFHNKHVKTKPA